jgi:hypothetical protein
VSTVQVEDVGHLVDRTAEPIDDLVTFVLGQSGGPIDVWGVAATLESIGLRDVDALERFGRRDIFALADDVYRAARAHLFRNPPPPVADAEVAMTARRRLSRFARYYGRGTFFALPMAVQIISVTTLGYGLWAYTEFSVSQATIVAVATIASLIVTGGWVQAIARLGLFYGEQGSHVLAQKIMRRGIVIGAVSSYAVGALAWLGNLATGAYPVQLATVGLVYYEFLCAYWLVLAILYTLERRLAIIATSVFGLALIAVLREVFDASMYVAHWCGLALTIVSAAVWGRALLRKRAAEVTGDLLSARLPRAELLAYAVAPYFAYGILYYGYLFVDRIAAWSVIGEFPVTFETAYELGLDWALLLLILTIAVLEYTINEFARSIIPVQRATAADARMRHNRHFERFYARQLGLLSLFSIGAALVTYYGVLALRGLGDKDVARALDSPVTLNVFFWGALGYSILVWPLLNGVFFFSLSRPALVLRALVPSVAVTVVVSVLMSRMLHYYDGAIGLVVGAVVFAVFSTALAIRVVRRMDYYYYAAF